MASSGCKPDAVTFSTLITAYDKGGQWPLALQVPLLACYKYGMYQAEGVQCDCVQRLDSSSVLVLA